MSTPPGFVFPVEISAQGLQPQSPSSLLSQLIANVSAQVPGYTATLPGSMIEDISSTVVAAIALCDQAKVELIDSLTPFGANVFLLQQLGQIYGLILGQPTNTSVNVVFSGTVGYVITNGFQVSDGTNVYQVQGGGVITNTGSSAPLNAIAIDSGSFAVQANTVTTLITSVPSTIALSVSNPTSGSPGGTAETYYSYRARVLQAGLAASVGTARYIKTLLTQVSGVAASDVSVVQANAGIRVIATGGNTYQIAYAIFCAVADIGVLQGSAINSARNVTVSLFDYPNTYQVLYVNTPTQTVSLAVTWNTTAVNFTGGSAFASLVQTPLSNYINALAPGQAINILEMNEIFQVAVQGVLDPSLLTRLVFAVTIAGTYTPPGSGTYAVFGDPESNFNCPTTAITVVQG